MQSLWRLTLQVRSYEGDRRGFLKPQALLNYFEEAAQQHATQLGFGYEQLLRASQFWLLSRLHVVIGALPRWGESITIETWPKSVSRLFALRDFYVYPGSEPAGEPVIRASSAWLLMDGERGRPLRPQQHLSEGPLSDNTERHAIAEVPRKLPETEGSVPLTEVRARYSDIDVNDHVNNSVYIRWFDDALRAGQGAFEPSEMELNFLKEARQEMALVVLADRGYPGIQENEPVSLELRDEGGEALVRGALRYRAIT